MRQACAHHGVHFHSAPYQMTPPMMQPPVLFAHTNGDLGYRHPVTAAEMAPVNNPGNPQAAHQDQFHPLSILPRFSSTWPLKRCLCQHNSSRRQLHCQLKSGSAPPQTQQALFNFQQASYSQPQQQAPVSRPNGEPDISVSLKPASEIPAASSGCR